MDDEPERAIPPADATITATIDRWFRDHFHGSVVARDVGVYNHVHAAVEELKRRLAKRSE